MAAHETLSLVSTVDHAAGEVRSKIVYYGPALSGRTTSLQYIYRATAPDARSAMVSIANESLRTMAFELVPATLRTAREYKMRFTLITTSSAYYDESRRVACADADAVVFVADSQSEREEANITSWEELATNLAICRIDYATIPGVRQFNKRDLPAAAPIAALDKTLAHPHWPYVAAVATKGEGVFDALKIVARWVTRRAREDRSLWL